MTKSKIFFWILIAFIGGIGAASFLPPSVVMVWAVFVVGAAAVMLALRRWDERPTAMVVGFLIIIAALGMLWFWRATRPPPRFISESERVAVVGVVIDEPVQGMRSQRLVLRGGANNEKILIVTRRYPEYRYGDLLRASGRLEPPENFSPDFNYTSYLAKDEIFLTMRFPEIVIQGYGPGNTLREILFRLRSVFIQNLRQHLPEPHASFLSGLLVGERSSLPEELADELRITGTTHLVALSGYNITIVADALLKGLLFFFVPFSAAFFGAVLGIILFVILTGAQASAVRAAIMGILVLVARREGRQYRMRNALAFAAALMLLANPKILRFDVGFQLSFLATLGLIYGSPLIDSGYEKIKQRLALWARDRHVVQESPATLPRRKKKALLREVLISTLAAQLFVLPLLVYDFGRLSLVSPLANLAILPVIPATMFFGFLTGSAAFVSAWLGTLSALPTAVLLGYELGAIEVFSRVPLAAVSIRGAGLALFFIGYAVGGLLLWRRFRHAKS